MVEAGVVSGSSTETMLRKALAQVSLREVWAHARVGLTDGYERRSILKNGALELVVVTWAPGGASTLHGHGESVGVLRVITGAVWEERYVPTGGGVFSYERHPLATGESSEAPLGAYHRITSVGASITLHAYSPELLVAQQEVDDATLLKLREARRRREA